MAGADCYVFFSSIDEADAVRAWLSPLASTPLRFAPQVQSSDLGARLDAALREVFVAGHRRAAVVGSDVPDLDAATIQRAFSALDDRTDAVFGPAADGGYYLLGLGAAPPAGLFSGVAWSSAAVLQQSLANARRCGLSVAAPATLPTLADIDTVHDLEAWTATAVAAGRGEESLVAVAAEILDADACPGQPTPPKVTN